MNLKIDYPNIKLSFHGNIKIVKDSEGSVKHIIYEQPTVFPEAFDDLINSDEFCSDCNNYKLHARREMKRALKEIKRSDTLQKIKIKALQGYGQKAYAFMSEDGDIIKITNGDHFAGRTPDVFDLPIKQAGRIIPKGKFYYYIEEKVSQENITQEELKGFIKTIKGLGYDLFDYKNSDVDLPFISININQFGKTRNGQLYLIDPECAFKKTSKNKFPPYLTKLLSRFSFFVR